MSTFRKDIASLVKEEEEVRREVLSSLPVVYTEHFLQRADGYVFGKHPYGRYIAGAVGGLFINYIVRRKATK